MRGVMAISTGPAGRVPHEEVLGQVPQPPVGQPEVMASVDSFPRRTQYSIIESTSARETPTRRATSSSRTPPRAVVISAST